MLRTLFAAGEISGTVSLLAGEVSRIKELVPGVEVCVDDETSSAISVGSNRGFLTGPNGEGGALPPGSAPGFALSDPERSIKRFLSAYPTLSGVTATEYSRARRIRSDVSTGSGLRTVVVQQEFAGIPIFEGVLQANVTARGELVHFGSRFLPNPEVAAKNANPEYQALISSPKMTAVDAIQKGANALGVDVAAETIRAESVPYGAERKQRLVAPVLSDISASLAWQRVGPLRLRLCWQVVLSEPKRGKMFLFLVDIVKGGIVLQRCLTEEITDASYRVYTSDSPSPFSPGHATPSSIQPPVVSRALITTPALNLGASPTGWIPDGVNETNGNNVDAHTDLDANNSPDLPRPQGNPVRVFDFSLDLAQSPATYTGAAVTQLFYLCNFVHDRLYELGFTESAGNFQVDNFGKGGLGNDAVQADAQDGSGTNNANFSTPTDGSPGRMQMYTFTYPVPARDGDLDAEIVIHEYVHGLSNRLVGGGIGMSALQSRGMGEGWSDFYALSLLSESGDSLSGNYASGGYATYQFYGLQENYYYGIRRYPYSTDLQKNPLTFKDIDPTKASSHSGIPRSSIIGTTADEVHNMGEVWCVTLWEMRANLVAKYGYAVGSNLTLQLVTTAMKLSAANPTFLQSRDAILQADLVVSSGSNKSAVWNAFAKRGMGASAVAPASTTATGVTEAFDLPGTVSVSPTAPANFSGPVGGPFQPGSQQYTVVNSGTVPLNWFATANVAWISLSPASGNIAVGGTSFVTASVNSNATALSGTVAAGAISFADTADSLNAVSRAVVLNVVPGQVVIYSLDTDPGWTRQGEWAYGTPLGGGGTSYGSKDPTSGATGTSVFGINLAGNYSTALGGPWYLQTGAIDLSKSTATKLAFKRWLNCDYPPYVYETVDVSKDGINWTNLYSNPSSSVVDSAWTSVQYDISSVADKQPTVFIRWGHRIGSSGAFAYSGWNIDDIEILGNPITSYLLGIPARVTEGQGVLTGTLTKSGSFAGDVTVGMVSSNNTLVAVPLTVTIPAGQTSGTFPITILDDNLLNGSREITLSATSAGISPASAKIVVDDNETAILSIIAPSSFSEGAGLVTGTVVLNAAPSSAVSVQLLSSNTTAATVPTSVLIPAGINQVTFPIQPVNDVYIDGAQAAVITASVANWTPGTVSVTVLDNETSSITLTTPVSLVEGNGSGLGTVTLGGVAGSPLQVSLASSDPASIAVPATVTIPAGSSTGTFALALPDDSLSESTKTVTISSSAAGFTGDSKNISLLDNDPDHFSCSAVPSPQLVRGAFPLTVTAFDPGGGVTSGFTGQVAVRGSGNEALSTGTLSGWVNGIWTGNLSVNAASPGVSLIVGAGPGASGTSNSFAVQYGAPHHLSWATISSTQNRNTYIPVSVSVRDAAENLLPVDIGNANLSVSLPGVGTPVAIDPSTAQGFQNGVWNGQVSIPVSASVARLVAEGGGLSGTSNAFSVVPTQWNTDPALTLFSETFESGTLGYWWNVTGTGFYRTQVTTANSPHAGAWHLTMDSSSAGASYARNEATLVVNLAGYSGVVLSFWAVGFSDDPNAPATNPFQYGADFDGVAISVDGVTWYEVQALRSLGYSYGKYTVDLDAAVAAYKLSYNSTFRIRFNQYDNFEIATDGIGIDDIAITSNRPQNTSVSIPVEVMEGVGLVTGTVSLGGAALSSGTISLASDSPAKVIVPASIVIAAGQSSGTFGITVLNNAIVDGDQVVTIYANAQNAASSSATMIVHDNELLPLSVLLPTTVTEGQQSVTGVVMLNQPSATPVTVSLASNDTGTISVVSNVTIPAGETFGSFALSCVDDNVIEDTRQPVITVSLPYLAGISKSIVALDNEPRLLALNLPSQISEGGVLSGTVSTGYIVSKARQVTLASANPAIIGVPPTVTISASSSSAIFSLSALDDTVSRLSGTVSVTASSSTFSGATGNIGTLDNDAAAFSFAAVGSPKQRMTSFPVTITALGLDGLAMPSFAGTAALSSVSKVSSPSISPSVTGSFTQGSWTGNVLCDGTGSAVALVATRYSASGTSNTFAVEPYPSVLFSPQSLDVAVALGSASVQQLTLSNTGGGTLTWTASEALSWISLSPNTGTIASGSSQNIAVTFDASASSTGTFTGTISFTTNDPASNSFALPVKMRVQSAVGLDVNPFTEFATTGTRGGPFAPAAITYTIANTGSTSLNWILVNSGTWLTFNRYNGTIIPGGSSLVTGTIATLATTMATGTYSGTASFIALGSGTVACPLKIQIAPLPAQILVSPTSAFDSVGDPGGNYVPSSKTYTITNVGDAPAQWMIAGDAWLEIPFTTGTLQGSSSVNVSIPVPSSLWYRWNLRSDLLATERPNFPANGSVDQNNPNRRVPEWSYGYRASASGTSLTLFSPTLHHINLSVNPPCEGWQVPSGSPTIIGLPILSLVFPDSSDELLMHPSSSGLPTTYVIARWTAPSSGAFAVSANWRDGDPGGSGGVDAHLVVNGTSVFDVNVVEGGTSAFSGKLNLLKGDQVDTVVGPNGSSGYDSTGVKVLITGTTRDVGSHSGTVSFINVTNGLGDTVRAVNLQDLLRPPVLASQPLFTSGTSKLLTWGTASGAVEYEVQSAANPAFDLPTTTGWISGTSSTFSGLNDGITYSYRARARRFLSVGGTALSSWSSPVFSTQDASAPVVYVATPAISISGTATLTGTAWDISGVSGLTLNGTSVSSSDGFAHWSSSPVTLQPGSNAFTITGSDSVVPFHVLTISSTIYYAAPGMDVDADGLPDDWEAANGINFFEGNGANGLMGDPDLDGIPNLLEYAFNLRPDRPDVDAMPKTQLQLNPADGKMYMIFTYSRRIDAGWLSYMPEVTYDGSAWFTDFDHLVEVSPAIPNPDGVTESVTVVVKPSISNPTMKRGYVRVRVGMVSH